MSHSKPSRRPHVAAKFPLTLHPTGQYCKKIHGKMYYFGKDKAEALRLYYNQATTLHATHATEADRKTEISMTLRTLCNLYLEYQHTQVAAGEIGYNQYYQQTLYLSHFAKHIGPDTPVSEIRTADIQQYRAKFVHEHLAATTINNYLSPVKAMYNWALANEVIEHAPNLKAVKKITPKKVERQTFTPDEIHKLLAAANPPMRAMILLGLNGCFGVTDCAELRWDHLNLDTGKVDFPRGKTGVQRRFTLWPETIAALRELPVRGELVFYTKQGNPWVRSTNGDKKAYDRPLCKEFVKLMRKAKIVKQKGTGFYTLRRTASTIAAETGDAFAVQGILGHADLTVASTYVQRRQLTPQTDKAVQHTREWLQTTDGDDSE